MNPESDQAFAAIAGDLPRENASSRAAEFTARAILAGCLIGALLAAGNVYTGLKTGYVDGGSITAAVVAFAFLGAKRGGGARPYSITENNLSQTIASSAAVMSFVTGVTGPIGALTLSGHSYPFWAIAVWGIALGAFGIVIARSLRQRLIVVEALPFPTGRATGEVIETMHSAGSKDLGRARVLLIAAIVAALVTWFRDAKPILIPQGLTLPWGHAALTAASLWLGVSVSPVMLSAGALIGPRGGVSFLLGTVGAWGFLAPALLAFGWVTNTDYGALSGWLLWPGVALLVSSALTALLMDWRNIVRGASDLATMRKSEGAARGEPAPVKRGFWTAVTIASIIVAVGMAWGVFDIHPLLTLAALVFAFVMAGVCARAAGETDLAPTGSAGALGQILFGAPNIVTSLLCGGVTLGSASQTAQTMWAFKAGHRLKADAHVQSLGQLLGLVVGAVVVVPVYSLIVRVYGLGTTVMPAPGPISWKAMADAVQLGTTAMPHGAGFATAIAFTAGVVLTLLGTTRLARYLPSAVPLGIAFLIPAPLGGAIFLGSMAFAILRALRPQWTDKHLPSLAAGAIAGESLTGIVIAALLASGFLG
ncbi:MAG TPA: OPT family oligopeptide transporter [Polyangiaceae bacterium]|nr:OPT family oligopeptide transporter [Polyangiaceae bacterium]